MKAHRIKKNKRWEFNPEYQILYPTLCGIKSIAAFDDGEFSAIIIGLLGDTSDLSAQEVDDKVFNVICVKCFG